MYTWQEIEQDWLAGGKLALPPEQVVRAFNTVVAQFGRDWVEASHRRSSGDVRGVSPTLDIVALGRRLESLGGAPNAAHLLDTVRDRQDDARAELAAIHLVRSDATDIDLEVEPEITVSADTAQ